MPGTEGVAVASGADHGALGDKQGAGRGLLGVVLGVDVQGDVVGGATACQGGEHQAHLQVQAPSLVRLEQRLHVLAAKVGGARRA